MFANILDKFSPAAAFAVKLFAAAKLDFMAMLAAGDENALKAHIEKSASSSDITAAVAEATKQLSEQLTAAQHEATAHRSLLTAHTTALAAVGIAPKVSDEKAGLTAADVEKAIRERASVLAQEQLAKTGLPAPLPIAPAADAAAPAVKPAAQLTGLARVTAAFKAQREAARV